MTKNLIVFYKNNKLLLYAALKYTNFYTNFIKKKTNQHFRDSYTKNLQKKPHKNNQNNQIISCKTIQ